MKEKQLLEFLEQLETMLPHLRRHYRNIESENSAYSYLALFNIGKAIDGVTDAIIGLRGE